MGLVRETSLRVVLVQAKRSLNYSFQFGPWIKSKGFAIVVCVYVFPNDGETKRVLNILGSPVGFYSPVPPCHHSIAAATT